LRYIEKIESFSTIRYDTIYRYRKLYIDISIYRVITSTDARPACVCFVVLPQPPLIANGLDFNYIITPKKFLFLYSELKPSRQHVRITRLSCNSLIIILAIMWAIIGYAPFAHHA